MRAFVAFGGNQRDVPATYAAIAQHLRQQPGVRSVRSSSLLTTQPVGIDDADLFANGCYEIVADEQRLPPRALFAELRRLEDEFGRLRRATVVTGTSDPANWRSRPADLDLVLIEAMAVDYPELIVPHPRMAYRRFVLGPLCELDPDVRHPYLDASAAELLSRLDDTAPPLILLADPGQEELRTWAESCWRSAFPKSRIANVDVGALGADSPAAGARLAPVGAGRQLIAIDSHGNPACPIERAKRTLGQTSICHCWAIALAAPAAPPSIEPGEQTLQWSGDILPVLDFREMSHDKIAQSIELFFASRSPF